MSIVRIPILAFDTEGTPRGEFTSVSEAADSLNVSQGAISRILKGDLSQTKGYTFIRKNEGIGTMRAINKINRYFQIREMSIKEYINADIK